MPAWRKKAVLEQADAQGWRERPEVERQTRAAAEQIVFRDYLRSVSQVPAGYPSEDELKQAYDAGKANWTAPALYRVSQIFLAATEPQTVEAVRRQALELSKKAQASPAEFGALASRFFPRTAAVPSAAVTVVSSPCSNWSRRCVRRWRA
nr:hypothetical protein GCM10020185_77440 [Pseudomonas brassicacearum subsp. brassicacearum]